MPNRPLGKYWVYARDGVTKIQLDVQKAQSYGSYVNISIGSTRKVVWKRNGRHEYKAIPFSGKFTGKNIRRNSNFWCWLMRQMECFPNDALFTYTNYVWEREFATR